MTWEHRSDSDGNVSPDFLIQRQVCLQGKEDPSGSVYWRTFAAVRVRGFHLVVNQKGTTTGAAAGYTVFGLGATIGTASIGQLTAGTNAVDYAAHGTVTTTLAANEGLRFTKGVDASLIGNIVLEYETLKTAVMS